MVVYGEWCISVDVPSGIVCVECEISGTGHACVEVVGCMLNAEGDGACVLDMLSVWPKSVDGLEEIGSTGALPGLQ